MQLSRFAPIAALLALTLACEQTPEPVTPTDGPSFAAGGKSDHQSASGYATVITGSTGAGIQEYTFSADAKKGEFSGQVNVRINNGPGLIDLFLEGDVTCLSVDSETKHARMIAHITRSEPAGVGGFLGRDIIWTVTDGGSGADALPDAASFIFIVDRFPELLCATFNPAEQANEQNDIKVKP